MYAQAISLVVILTCSLTSIAETPLRSEAATQMMSGLKSDLQKTQDLKVNVNFDPSKPFLSRTENSETLQRNQIQNLKGRFETLSSKQGIGLLERSTYNELSMMLSNVLERKSFDASECNSLRTELRSSFDPLGNESQVKPELREVLDVVGILCKDIKSI